jgi:succinate-acetate transporter protein
MAPNNGLNDAVRIDDKMLRDAEEGHAMQHLVKPVVSTPASGIGNPAPLGLLCFGMTTGALCCFMHAPAHWAGQTLPVTCMRAWSRCTS